MQCASGSGALKLLIVQVKIIGIDTALSSTLNAFNSANSRNININQELDKVNIWFKLNKLSINPTKTKAMLFYTPQRYVIPVDLVINDSRIEYVNHFNSLYMLYIPNQTPLLTCIVKYFLYYSLVNYKLKLLLQ